MHLDELLDAWSVVDADLASTPQQNLTDWHAVCDDENGIVAYFLDERAALRFRLAEINRVLNG